MKVVFYDINPVLRNNQDPYYTNALPGNNMAISRKELQELVN
jgi:hypothetical protein